MHEAWKPTTAYSPAGKDQQMEVPESFTRTFGLFKVRVYRKRWLPQPTAPWLMTWSSPRLFDDRELQAKTRLEAQAEATQIARQILQAALEALPECNPSDIRTLEPTAT